MPKLSRLGAAPVPAARLRRRRSTGFTLIEMVMAMVLLTVVIGSVLSLIMSQTRYVSRISGDAQQLDQVRTAQEILSLEIADLPRGGVTFARSDSLVYRLPIRWGLVCGLINRNQVQVKLKKGEVAPTVTTVAMQLEDPADALGTPTADGIALTPNGTTFAYYPVANWSTLGLANDTIATYACFSQAATGKKAKKPPKLKKGALPPPVETQTVDSASFYRSTGLIAASGGVRPQDGTLMFAYINVSYFLKTDGTAAGNQILYRSTSAGTHKLAWPFAPNAAFNYRLDDASTASTITAGNVARIRAVQVNLPAVRTARSGAKADTMNVQPWLTLFNAR